MDLTSPREAPGSGRLQTCVLNPGWPSPTCPQRAAFISRVPDRPQDVWVPEGRRGPGFPSGVSLLSYSPAFTRFIMGRGLQGGFGEICSTLFTLKF